MHSVIQYLWLPLLLLLPSSVYSTCPFLLLGTPPTSRDDEIPLRKEYNKELLNLDIPSVFDDLYDLMTDSQDCWPADRFNGESNYGPLMIRLAWHCAGTFRNTDGVGGCAGGRQRFYPEASWDDNVNLDKARALIAPIKEKYGDALSWGDLFVFAGTAAIIEMGGPATEICAGRIDESDGTNSYPLNEDCGDDGNCEEPFGASTIGLIYVNPEGVMGVPDPSQSAPRIRDIFGRMGMNDTETVALIGGGHAFGKSHGACPDGPGLSPADDPFNPWPGLCGDNFPEDTTTSGIEGQWTKYPLKWDNDYFKNLVKDGMDYELIIGPGGKYQWENDKNGLMMQTTDLAFLYDDIYTEIVKDFAYDLDALDIAFSSAWAKLVTNGGTWARNSFCIDADDVRPAKSKYGGKYSGKNSKKSSSKKSDSSDSRGGGKKDKSRRGSGGHSFRAQAVYYMDLDEKGDDHNEVVDVVTKSADKSEWSEYIMFAVITLLFNAFTYGLTYTFCIRKYVVGAVGNGYLTANKALMDDMEDESDDV